MSTSTAAPWGVQRLALYPDVTPVPYARTEIDPETQVTRYLDADGNRIEMAGHGTGTTTANQTSTSSDGGGPNPPPPSDEDLTDDSDSD
ncbi:putative ATP-grasp-modified RiPP [Streptomyces sp. ASQP_92]|uniref:putative ATP-grasp-modified RiPP n=1 Tax=Streptomyces sp. ASQP_92 TaxID=2979116 RepID=UPI0021BF423E|nr:putative ATP-grasp-modified RiPP [Streptomyces sp. ASQP_92]MCT9090570.1 putative ATP-grasp-modified RiPP [Streptomyces sp. ASQP_92]